MTKKKLLLLYAILFSSILPLTTVEGLVRYIPILLSYSIIAGVVINEINKIEIPIYVVLSLGIIWLVFVFHVVNTPVRGGWFNSPIIRSPLFIVFTTVNILFIPKIFSIEDFVYALATSSFILVIIGLPSYFGSYSIYGLELAVHPDTHDLLGINFYSSIFAGPNMFSRYIVGGVFSSLILYSIDKSYFPILATNIGGIVLAGSQASIGITVVGFSLYAIYMRYGYELFYLVSATGGVILAIIVLIISGIIPGPSTITNLNPARRILWRAGIKAWENYPILGTGPINTADAIRPGLLETSSGRYWIGTHVHNSYIRVLITTGLLGFIPYVYFHVRSIMYQTTRLDGPYSLGILLLAIVYTANQVSNVYSLFGLSATSVITAITFGYIIKMLVEHHNSEDKYGHKGFQDANSNSTE